jgi:hypothetical protein
VYGCECVSVREYVCVHLIHIHIHIIVKHVSEWTTVHNTCVGVYVGVYGCECVSVCRCVWVCVYSVYVVRM